MKTTIFLGSACALCLGLPVVTASDVTGADLSPKAGGGFIQRDQIGDEVARHYHGTDLGVMATANGVMVRCAIQKLEGSVSEQGLRLKSTATSETPSPVIQVRADAVGRGPGNVLLSKGGTVAMAENIARWVRPGLIEEYSVTADGIRQDFLVLEKPEGPGDLKVDLDVTGATVAMEKAGVRLIVTGSGRHLAYSKLTVTDASGKGLAARFAPMDAHRLTVIVDDSQAKYPIRIDPTFSDADWISMGVGDPMNQRQTISAVATDTDGNVYIGGDYLTFIGGLGPPTQFYILKWDGSEWSTLATPSEPGANPDLDNSVWTLVMNGTDLYVGGAFTHAGGIEVNRVAKWNTVTKTWSALGSATGVGVDADVRSMAVSGSEVYVAGEFNNAGGTPALRLAKWSAASSTWSDLGFATSPETAGIIEDLAIIGDDLFVGGSFGEVGGVTASCIARRNAADGQWHPLGLGTDGTVYDLASSGADLFVGGDFLLAGGLAASRIARWSGDAWLAVGSGVDATVRAVAAIPGGLLIGGAFQMVGGERRADIARIRPDGGLDMDFNPGAGGTVLCSAKQADGKILLGGYISSLSGLPRNNLARLNADNTVDGAFNPALNAEVRAVAVQADGGILIGGGFTSAGGASRTRLARLNSDGSLDSTFNPVLAGPFGLSVAAVAVQADGKILIGGNFTSVNSTSGSYFARLFADGTLDTSFAPQLNGTVDEVIVQPDGKILIRGSFWTVNGSGTGPIARLNANGTRDTSFNLSAAGPLRCMALQPDGKLLVGGGLGSSSGGETRRNLVRFNVNGSLDTSFPELNLDGTVRQATVQANGSILIGGDFTHIGTAQRSRLAQINSNGTLDGTVNTTVGGSVNEIVVCADGGILFVGNFSHVGGTVVDRLARWDGASWYSVGNGKTDGDVTDFASNGEYVFAIGGFGKVDGIDTLGLARMQVSTGRWTAPGVGVSDRIRAAIFHDGRLYIGGDFLRAGGAVVNRIAMWDGDSWWALGSGMNEPVHALAIDDSYLYAGGEFTTAGGISANAIARWNFTAQTWAPLADGVAGTVRALAVDGPNIFVGGSFGGAGGNITANIACWNAADNAWSPLGQGIIGYMNGGVNALAIADGNLYAAGYFHQAGASFDWSISRITANGIVDSAPIAPFVGYNGFTCVARGGDGTMVFGLKDFTDGLRKFHPNGGYDLDFTTAIDAIDFAQVDDVAIQANGKILVAGRFRLPDEVDDRYLMRLETDGTVDLSFAPAIDHLVGFEPDSKGVCIAIDTTGNIIFGSALGLARISPSGVVDANFAANPGACHSVAFQNDGKIIVGGSFEHGMIRLHANGTVDSAFAPAWRDITAVDVLGIAVQNDGRLVAAGKFSRATDFTSSESMVVCLTNAGERDSTFSAIVVSPSFFNQSISDVAIEPDGHIVFVGDFTEVWAHTPGIAKWNGTAWSGLGLGISGPVNAIALNGSHIYAGGTIGIDGSDINIQDWNGNGWAQIAPGLPSWVSSLVVHNNELYAGLSDSNGRGLYRWDGTSWSEPASGIQGEVSALTVGNGVLYSAGWFEVAGGKPSSNLAALVLPSVAVPELVVEYPPGTPLTDGSSSISFGALTLGTSVAKTLTIRNAGDGSLTGITIGKDGAHPGNYLVSTAGMSETLVPGASTTFTVSFAPAGTASGERTAAIHLAGNETAAVPFDINLTGTAFSTTADADNDGLNDWAEFQLAALGFDWQTGQPTLVAALSNGANAAGLFTASQVQALNIGTPLLQRDPVTGSFRLTIGVEKSTDLTHFSPFPMSAPQTIINANGKLEFLFTTPDNAAFFKVQAD